MILRRRSRDLCSLTITVCSLLLALSTFSFAADAESEQAALKALMRGVATNLQKNRDGTVRLIRFSKSIVTDETLSHLPAFTRLDYLGVVGADVSDAGLQHISSLKNLDTLVLQDVPITNAGLAHLDELPKLERLYLDRTPIDDEGLTSLSGLITLKTLSLRGTRVTDAGLVPLAGLPNLEVLDLSGTGVTDLGLTSLAGSPHLRVLDLGRTSVSGSAFGNIAGFKSLESLTLDRTRVSDSTLEAIARMENLKHVSLLKTNVTAAGAATISAALPKATVALPPAAWKDVVRHDSPRKKPAAPSSEQPSAESSELTNVLPPAAERFRTTSDGRGFHQKPIPETQFPKPNSPDFQQHVVPLLGKLGCNGRACHGSFQGQGGFRLSMFGYDFKQDHDNLTAGDDPRVDLENPAESLILNKPTSKIEDEHGGGLRYEKHGWEYNLLHRWIADGAKNIAADAPHFVRLDVTPQEVAFQKKGDSAQLRAVAVWSDGTREDVTCLTRFQTNNDAVASVTPDGLITADGPGDTYIVSFYDNGVFTTQAILPVSDQTGDAYPPVPTPTPIDELVVAKLSKLGIVPSELSTDEEFLRRVSLDLVGTLPTPKEILDFTADESPDKRSRKIDDLLERPAYVVWWTQKLCDLTGENAGYLGSTEMASPSAQQWRDWLERRVRDDVGWDEIAEGMIVASTRRPGETYDEFIRRQSRYTQKKAPTDYTALDNPMTHYWFRSNQGQPKDKALTFGYTFLGVRLQCAECHKHPFDQWSQQDFQNFTEFFTRIKAGVAPDVRESDRRMQAELGVPKKLDTAALRRQCYLRVAAEGRPIPWREVYVEPPTGKKSQSQARLLGAETVDLNKIRDPRVPLMEWLRRADNPYFAPAFVNRVWAHYFNVGIVDPPDDFNMANPPSNKPLLNRLSRDFINNGYRLKWLHRAIANSRTYQLSWRPNATNRGDERNFSRSVIRRMPAEVAVDAILQSTANDQINGWAPTVVSNRKIGQHPRSYQARTIDYSLLIFGKSLRSTTCDCERQAEPTLLQSLYVKNDREVLEALERPNGWIAQIAKELKQPLPTEFKTVENAVLKKDAESAELPAPEKIDDLITRAWLRTLSRNPEDHELSAARGHIEAADTATEGLHDLMWALLNTQEFITNH